MRIKSVCMVEDAMGHRYSYPAVVFDFPEYSDLMDAVKALRRAGYVLMEKQGGRAILRRHNEYRYVCVL